MTYYILFSAVYFYLKNHSQDNFKFKLACSKEGWEWEVIDDNAAAGFFILFHMIIIGAPVGQFIDVFYNIPNKFYYFQAVDIN